VFEVAATPHGAVSTRSRLSSPEGLILANDYSEDQRSPDFSMRIAVVNLIVRTVKSKHLLPQLDPDMPVAGVRTESPMAVLLADELASMGHEVDIFVGSMFDVVRDSELSGENRASILYTKETLRWAFPPSFYPFAPSLVSRVREGQYDVVLTTDLIQPCTMEAIVAKPAKARTFVWQELASHPRFPASLYSRLVFSLMRIRHFRGVEKMIPRSNNARSFLLLERAPEHKISAIIPNAVDCKVFSPDQPSDFFLKNDLGDPSRPRTIMVSRIDRSKGIDIFLKAAEIAVDGGYEGSFVLKVTGSGTSEIESLASKLGLKEKVTIVGGYLPRRNLANLIASCDICAAPSSGDLLFFVPIEAMACGVPVITTTQTHHASTFSDGKAGLLIPANDPNALAESIMRLSRDRTKLKEMALSARQMAVRDFSMESVARRLIEVFEEPGGGTG